MSHNRTLESVSERLAAAIVALPPVTPGPMEALCQSLLIDVAGICISVAPTKVHKAGFHPTAVFGAIGAAAGVGAAMNNGELREARQGHFRGGVNEPLSRDGLLKKFRANCRYGGLSADRTGALLEEVGALLSRPAIDLHALRCT